MGAKPSGLEPKDTDSLKQTREKEKELIVSKTGALGAREENQNVVVDYPAEMTEKRNFNQHEGMENDENDENRKDNWPNGIHVEFEQNEQVEPVEQEHRGNGRTNENFFGGGWEQEQEEERPRSHSPMSPELVAELLEIAGVTRRQAGLPEEEQVYGPHDYRVASRLQEEEERRQKSARVAVDSCQPSTSGLPSFSSDVGRRQGPTSQFEEHDRQVAEMWQLYDQCMVTKQVRFVPAPMHIADATPDEYIRGYRRVLEGHPFPDFESEVPDGPRVSPGSPGPVARLRKGADEDGYINERTVIDSLINATNALNKRICDSPSKSSRLCYIYKEAVADNENKDDDDGLFSGPCSRDGAVIPITRPHLLQNPLRSARLYGDTDPSEPPGLGADDAVFAVPEVPRKLGFSNLRIETSPAARRKRQSGQLKIVGAQRENYSSYIGRLAATNHTEIRSSVSSEASTSSGAKSSSSSYYATEHEQVPIYMDENKTSVTSTRPSFSKTDLEKNANASANWPSIPWKDPENMPPLSSISSRELLKMPAEYLELIIDHHSRPPKPKSKLNYWDRVEAHDKADTEKDFLKVFRSMIPTPSKVPLEVENTRFEVYIRFPFLPRPIYIADVLQALNLPDNSIDVIADVPEEYQKCSIAEFIKRAANIWRGLKLTRTNTRQLLGEGMLRSAESRFLVHVAKRLISDALQPLKKEDKKYHLSLIKGHLHMLRCREITRMDTTEISNYRSQLTEEQPARAQSQSPLTKRARLLGDDSYDDALGPPKKLELAEEELEPLAEIPAEDDVMDAAIRLIDRTMEKLCAMPDDVVVYVEPLTQQEMELLAMHAGNRNDTVEVAEDVPEVGAVAEIRADEVEEHAREGIDLVGKIDILAAE